MRRSKFSESQIVAMPKEAESGLAIPEVVRKHGISEATFFASRTKYGLAVAELKRLEALEQENSRLQRVYADLAIESAAIKEVLSRRL